MKFGRLRLALLIVFLISPVAAHADPVSLVMAVAGWISSVATVATVVEIGLTVGMAVYGSAQQRKAEQAAKDAYNAGLMDRTVTAITSDAPYRYIYGRARVGADIVAIFTAGLKDGLKYLVCVHAAHECDGIEEIYLNGEALGPLDANGYVTTGRFAIGNNTPVTLVTETHTGPVLTLNQTPSNDSSGLTTVRVYTGVAPNMAPVTVNSVVGQVVTIPITTPVTVTYYVGGAEDPSMINSTVRAIVHLGGPTDPADALMVGTAPDPGDPTGVNRLPPGTWPTTAVLRGFCYTVIQINLNEPLFQAGIPSVQVLIRGKQLYDPRTGTTAWSENPALAIYDYLTSIFCNVPAADLPIAQFITAANVCDDDSVVPGGRYTFDGTITSDQDQTQTLNAMAQSMAGTIVATTWNVFAGTYVAPIAELSQSDIVGSLTISPGISGATIYNGVKGQYVDAANDYVATDYPQYQNAAYRAADGFDYFANITYPFTNTLQRVYNLARIYVEDQRNAFTFKAEFSLKAWPLTVGDRITFDSAFIGQTAKIYRVTDKSYSPSAAVMLTLKEDDPSIWDFADAVTPSIGPTTNLPDPFLISALASLTCESDQTTMLTLADGSIEPRILVSWPEVMQQSVYATGAIQIDWCAVGDASWNTISVSGDATQTYISPVVVGVFYNIRARCCDSYLNAYSTWIFDYAVAVANPVSMNAVTGLELVGQGNNTVFQGKDAKFDWRVNSTTDSYDVGSEPVGNAGSNGPYFKDYEVRIYSVASTPALLRTDHTTDTTYTYTYEMNFSDTAGAPNRTFTIQVYQRGTSGQLSGIPATLTVSNPAPAAPSGLSTIAGPSSIMISAALPNATDIAGMIIWASTSSTFTPGLSNQIYIGTGNTFNYTGLTPYIPIYIYVAFFDTFSSDISELNLSSQLTAIPIASGVLVVATLPLTGAFIGECVYLMTDQNIYRWNGIAWTTAITASQITGLIAAGQISAIAASQITGTLTASQIASITAAQLTGQITSTQIADNSISTPMLQAGSVSTASLAAGAVTAATIAAGTITSTQIQAGSILSANIAAGTIAAVNIAANTITASQMSAGSVSTAVLQAGAVTASTIAAGAVETVSIASGAVTTATLAAGAVTASTMATGTITAASGILAAAAVGTLTIAGNAVTVPAGASSAGPAMAYASITLTQPGYISVIAMLNVESTVATPNANLMVNMTGTSTGSGGSVGSNFLTGSGVAPSYDCLCTTYSTGLLAAGTYTFTNDFTTTIGSGVTALNNSVTVLGTMR